MCVQTSGHSEHGGMGARALVWGWEGVVRSVPQGGEWRALRTRPRSWSLRFGLCALGLGPASAPPRWGMATPPRNSDFTLVLSPRFWRRPPGQQGQTGPIRAA